MADRNWKKKIRFGHSIMPKHVVNMGKASETEEVYRRLYPGVKSDHLPPTITFRSKRERREYFNK